MSEPWAHEEPPTSHGAPNQGSRGRQPVVVGLVVTVIAGLLAAGAFALVNRSSDSTTVAGTVDDATFVVAAAPVDEAVFETRDASSARAFFPLDAQLTAFADGTGRTPTEPEITSGNFGGAPAATCGQERLITYLLANPTTAEVWASAQGITVGQVPAFIRGLEAKTLAEPHTVLSFGYDPLHEVAFQNEFVLEAGTTVLVSADAEVRVRCYSGNPIVPAPIEYEQPRCLLLASLVFNEPGGDRADEAGEDITLTGAVATTETQHWAEVRHVDGSTTWTPTHNLGPGLCPPAIGDPGQCPQSDDVPVFDTSDGNQVIGYLGVRVTTTSGDVSVRARAQRAGGADGALVENGRVLIRFLVGDSNTGWVRAVDLAAGDCSPVRICATTTSPIRSGVDRLSPSSQPQYLEFQGTRLITDDAGVRVGTPESGVGAVFSGYIAATGYEPTDDSACGTGSTPTDCYARPAAEPVAVYDTPDQTGAAVAAVESARVTRASNVKPVNEMVLAQIGAGGPHGWLSLAGFTTDSRCVTLQQCVTLPTPLTTNFDGSGASITAPSGEQLVSSGNFSAVRDGRSVPHYTLIDGRRGWAYDVTYSDNDPETCRSGLIGQTVCIRGYVHATAALAGPIAIGATNAVIREDLGDSLRVDPMPLGPAGYLDLSTGGVAEPGGCWPFRNVCIALPDVWYSSWPPGAPSTDSPPDGYVVAKISFRLAGWFGLLPGGSGELDAVLVEYQDKTRWILAEDIDIAESVDDRPSEECSDPLPCTTGGEVCCLSGSYQPLPAGAQRDPNQLVFDTFPPPVADPPISVTPFDEAIWAERLSRARGARWHDYQVTDASPPEFLVAPLAQLEPGACGSAEETLPCTTAGDECCLAGRMASVSFSDGDVIVDYDSFRDVKRPLEGDVIARGQQVPLDRFPNDPDYYLFQVVGEGPTEYVIAPISEVDAGPCVATIATEPEPEPQPEPQPQPQPQPEPDPTDTPVPQPEPEPTETPVPCAADVDNDGICDDRDECIDADADLHCDTADNCIGLWNPGQSDSDNDGFGNECDTCPDLPNPAQGSTCGGPNPDPDPDPSGFDPLQLIGMQRSPAESLARQNGYSVVLGQLDDQVFQVPGPSRLDRLIISVSSGAANGGTVTGVRIG